jgi:uncharacterized protein (TIGR00730 family)
MTAVCVFCAASDQIDPAHIRHAFELGFAIGTRGWQLVSGGGSVSSMGAVAKGARQAGGETIGVIPDVLLEREVADHDSTRLIAVRDMRSRKAEMERLSDAFIVLPGGIGTLEEFFEIWVARSLGMHNKPVVVLDKTGIYTPLQNWLAELTKAGFITADAANCAAWASSVDQAIEIIEAQLATPIEVEPTDAQIAEAEL